ncbi:MAG TPA: thioredoxin domain-containing protein [Streptosporangiaceae bacterium]|nr:thioredoxin domain-containing protein [Streptosporangiaceae bacterium]
MPWLGRAGNPGERKSEQSGTARFSTRARVVAGATAALAVLAVLAVASVAGSGHPARAASRTTKGTGHSRAAAGALPGAQTYPGNANPNPSAHPNTIPGPAAPPVAPALTLGRPGAPVTMVEFGDYQCTNCGAFARDTEPALVRKYVDTGVVRLEWRDFPWVDAQSVAAAVAARAAGMQGKFWDYHDYLFAHQSPDEHSGLVTGAYLLSEARRLGLNMSLFGRDVAGPAWLQRSGPTSSSVKGSACRARPRS